MHVSPGGAPETSGIVIHWAARYQLVTKLLFLGREHAFREATLDLARVVPGQSVLDVGCGPGTLALAAKRRVGAGVVCGVDPSPEMIALARRKADRAGQEVDFRVGVIEALPFGDETFDVVLSSLMLHGCTSHPEHCSVGRGLVPRRVAMAAGDEPPPYGTTKCRPLPARNLEKHRVSDEFAIRMRRAPMLHHLPPEARRQGLADVHRVLRPGGTCLVVDLELRGHGVLARLRSHVIGPRHWHAPGESVCALMGEVGFVEVSTGPTPHRLIRYARCRKGES